MAAGRVRLAGLAVLLVALAVAGVAAGRLAPSPAPGTAPSAATAAATAAAAGLPAIRRADLPPEARATLDRIAAGGPFPYAADGSTFENRERLLPARPAGTYREYTVDTPGSADRGARRIVSATSGEQYWTADHYATFFRIVP